MYELVISIFTRLEQKVWELLLFLEMLNGPPDLDGQNSIL